MANILVPFDFSQNATTALDQAILLANQNNQSIEVLHITNAKVFHDYPQGWSTDPAFKTIDFIQQRLKEVVQNRIAAIAPGTSPDISTAVKESAMINGGIINHMLTSKGDLIIMGTHGRTNALDRFWGSNTSTMINHALFPILAIPRDWQATAFNEMIAALSLKDISKSMDEVNKWSEWMKTKLELISISSLPTVEQETLSSVMATYPEVKAHLVPKKDDMPLWRNLVQFTSGYKNAVLLMFVHERTVLEKLFNYSITSRVAEGIHIPLLAIPTAHK